MVSRESVFTLEASPIKFGPGAVDDAGWELQRLGVTRALLVTDPGVAASGHPDRVQQAIEREGIEVVVYDRARVEPELASLPVPEVVGIARCGCSGAGGLRPSPTGGLT